MDCFGTCVPRNDVLGYTARVLALALDNRRCHARSAMTALVGGVAAIIP